MKNRIGIIGGGQLGRMLVIAAKRLGFKTVILDPTPNSPAGQVADAQILGGFTDKVKINELASQCDYLTFEIELTDASVLDQLKQKGISINPSPKTLAIIKDKLRQKEFLKNAGILTAEFTEVNSREDILISSKKYGFPLLLKARTDAYDGRGNALLSSESDIIVGMEKLKGRLLYVEKYVPFVKELAVMVVRNLNEEVSCYPVVETTHKNNICHTVVVPAQVSESITSKAKSIAVQVATFLEGAGVFGVEMFLTKDNKIFVNEIAPRVHNSGHYTMEACKTSQFEQHIRAITGMPLGSTELIVPAAAMVNILGKDNRKINPRISLKAKKIAGVAIHFYGKMESRVERKMGHITAVGNTVQEALKKAELVLDNIEL